MISEMFCQEVWRAGPNTTKKTIELRTLQRFLQHCTITSKDLNFLEGTHVCGNPDIRKHID